MSDDLVVARQERLRAALADAPFDAFLAGSAANVAYATGYRGMPTEIYPRYRFAAAVSVERCVFAAPCGDAPAALDAGVAPDDFVAYGRCYYESPNGLHPATRMAENDRAFPDAIAEAVDRLRPGRLTIGVDEAALDGDTTAELAARLPGARLVPASDWMLGVRTTKLPGEVERLRLAAQLAERGIQRALEEARAGWTERQIAGVIASTMLEGGGMPRFLSVQTGGRGALGDAFATDRPWQAGELLRMDVGCTVDGYWSDMARTAVLGEPTPLQRQRFDALLAGQQAELEAIRPGCQAGALFDVALGTTRAAGLPTYRRHHCGHGIGLEIYEPPLVGPANCQEIQAGMVLCLETPFYEIGWGGILTEDTLVVTASGHDCFTTSGRDLRVVAR